MGVVCSPKWPLLTLHQSRGTLERSMAWGIGRALAWQAYLWVWLTSKGDPRHFVEQTTPIIKAPGDWGCRGRPKGRRVSAESSKEKEGGHGGSEVNHPLFRAECRFNICDNLLIRCDQKMDKKVHCKKKLVQCTQRTWVGFATPKN